jgi:crotonobetainyl-CoA:carnitine CoA-transferase CaiB-like acyl-CoA transferase
VSGSTPRMAERFLEGYGLGALLSDSRFATNEARVAHAEALDAVVRAAIGVRTLAENLAVIATHGLTAVHVQTIKDIERDPHWRARHLTVEVPTGSGTVRMQNVTPRLSQTPGDIQWSGGDLGAHNAEVYAQFGIDDQEQRRLREAGAI